MHRYISTFIIVFKGNRKKSGEVALAYTSVYRYAQEEYLEERLWRQSRAVSKLGRSFFQYAHDIRENNGFGTIGMVVIYLFFSPFPFFYKT